MGCTQGGCCSFSPPRLITDPDNPDSVLRVNVEFKIVGCCGPMTQPYSKEDMENVPPQLKKLGVTDEEWQHHTRLFVKALSRRKGCWCSVVPLLLCCACSAFKNEVMNTDGELREWQDNFNSLCLERKGIFCKTQSHCHATYDKNGKHRHFFRWVSFALTSEEIEKLKAESHLSGDIEDNTCCGGLNENLLCVHPF